MNQVFDDDVLMDEVMEIAHALARKSPSALIATKKLVKDHWTDIIHKAIKTDGQMFSELLVSPEAREAFKAFEEKREPDFSKFQK